MGRAARRKKERTAIRLDRGDYFELRLLLTDIEKVQLEAAALQNKLLAAQAKAQAKMTTLGAALGFDPKQNFRLDDTTLSLVAVQ